MALKKAWVAIAWLTAIAALPACATSGNGPGGGGGNASTSASSSGVGGSGGEGGSGGGTTGTGDAGPACGDGKLASTESCDDGNTTDGDGCSATCGFEMGWSCEGTPSKCTANCGDGMIVGEEACDDGNSAKADGCSPKCEVEYGWSCAPGAPSVCTTPCGDGIIAGMEQCDDGNMANGDGCTDACVVEKGFSCIGAPSKCSSSCGDGIIAQGEECDDHNFDSGDGCSDTCKVEQYWTCMGAPSKCATPCGDGHVLGSEACDDGNNADSDGCSNACAIEKGFTCSGEPSVCNTACGDGTLVAGKEQCDDGNAANGDGCNVNCKVEPGFNCTPTSPSICTSICGDGYPAGKEGCDDGNTVNGDGCSSTCQPETGYVCSNIPSICVTVCGDGVVGGNEQCDDGNQNNNDGCSNACNVQQGWNCNTPPGMPSQCTSICGDGIVAGNEQCDDGNSVNGDCCSSACTAEPACEIEPNDSIGTANDFDALNANGVVKGHITPAGESDYYSIAVAPNTTAALTAATIDGPTSSCLNLTQDSLINIYDPNGMQIGTDNDSGPGNCALLTVGGLSGGANGADYYIEVKGGSSSAKFDYGLQLSVQVTICGNGVKEPGEQCDDGNNMPGDGCDATCHFEIVGEIEPNNTTAQAQANGPFPLNALWSGSIGVIGDLDFYRIDLAKTADLRVETFDGTGPGSCTSVDTKIELRGSNGTTILANDDDAGINYCSLIDPTAAGMSGAQHLHPGTYYVLVHHYSDGSTIAAYTVATTTVALCGNGVKEGSEPCDGTANCDANCDIIPTCGDGIISGLETCDDGNTQSGDGCSSTCQIEGLPNESEPNNNFVQADALPVISGSTVLAGSIGAVGDKDIFKLNVTAPSVVRFENFQGITADCPSIATTIRLFDSNKTQMKIDVPASETTVESGINSCAALVASLSVGTYYVQVEKTSNNAVIAAYSLEVRFETSQGSEAEPNDTQATATALSGTDVYVFGNHQVQADIDYFAITVPAGKSIRAELVEGDASETCESNGMDSYMTLYNAAATSLVTDDDDGRGYCSAIDGTGAVPRDSGAHNLTAGTYYLQVKAYGSGAAGQFNYNLAVTVR